MKWIGKSEDGSTVTLRNIENCIVFTPGYANQQWINENASLVRTGIVLDVETTGLNYKEDKIIELGLRQFQFHRLSGEILSVGESYSGFEDPQIPLSDEIKKLTGITDDMLKDKVIDWPLIEKMFYDAHIIIAHNAAFDRPFIDLKVSRSTEKIWACSLKQIDWKQKGFTIHKLEILGIMHGFFIENAHRALNDVDALLYLISLCDETTQSPYFKELLESARRSTFLVKANNAPFDSKDLLKRKGYTWNSQDKCWFRTVYKDDIDSEILWLEKEVYKGRFKGEMQEIKLVDSFKGDRHE